MNYSLLDFLCLLGSVGLFLYGMKVMSEGLQKAAGDRLRNILSAMTRNRFAGLMTGFAITALIQSSSASTVMVVSFVNAGLMSLGQSMAVIFGANVGTTFTAWIIALFGFKVEISTFILPMVAAGVILQFSNSGKHKSIGEFLIGFALLFMGLDMISNYVPDLQSNPEMFAFLQKYASMGFLSVIIFLLVGTIVTAVIQSSAATFAIVLIMSTKGWITFDLACALILGSNIGTTVTPIFASMSGNVAAKRTAMGHLLFNFFGTIWTMIVFYPFCSLNAHITEWLGQGDPNSLFEYIKNLEATSPQLYNALMSNSLPAGHDVLANIAKGQFAVSFGLSMFHTVFNLVNVCIMIWFTNLYVVIVEKLIPNRNHDGGEEFHLKFISGTLMNSAELSLAQAEKELVVYSQRVQRMIAMAQELVHIKDSDQFTQNFSRIEKYEEISDRMEIEIAGYLNRCSEGRLSNESKHRLSSMLRMVSEIESIADCCYGIARIMERKRDNHIAFNDEIDRNIDSMFIAVEAAMTNQLVLLRDSENPLDKDIITSYNCEREINNLRNQLRTANVENINNHHYEYQAGIYYMDIIGALEKIGDYIINVVDEIKALSRKPKA